MVWLLAAFALSLLATRGMLGLLLKRRVMDIPNQRSNHVLPTPRGAGLGVILAIAMVFGGWCAYSLAALAYAPFLGMAVFLSVFSFWDDVKPLPASLRFFVQVLAVGVSLYVMRNEALVFQGLLPFAWDRALAAILWLWFINLYNFMDGIDGITGAETLALGLGIALLGTEMQGVMGLILAGAALGFLVWNWHPAKIFLGDSGSVSLGYLLGGLLLLLAMQGYWLPALLLPGYYVFDSSFTLLRRMLKKEKIWQAHSQHFYQQAVRRGMSPRKVVMVISIANLLLIGLAWLVMTGWLFWLAVPLAGVVIAGAVSALLLSSRA